MKFKDFECIRRMELLLPIAIRMITIMYPDIDLFGMLDKNSLYLIISALNILYTVDITNISHTEKLTTEYKEMKVLYDEVIDSVSDLSQELELDNPVEIFAFYVYLYRNGYLSYNKFLEYDIDLKDFPNLNGLDIIRGKGVCRSISSMLVDIYQHLGFESANLGVYATDESCYQQDYCDTELSVSETGVEKIKMISKIFSLLPGPNHQITGVYDTNYGYIFDPTNGGMLHYHSDGKVYVPNTQHYMTVKKADQLLRLAFGKEKSAFNLDYFSTAIDEETYRELYSRTLELCRNNQVYLEDFYRDNMGLYEDIFRLAEEQRSFAGRLFPIFPQKILKK